MTPPGRSAEKRHGCRKSLLRAAAADVRRRRAPSVLAVFLLTASGALHAQEFSLLGGVARGIGEHTYTWAASYQEGLGEYFAASFTWLNEGHVTGHHRDGQLVQGWVRLPLAERRLVFSAGIGPYRYFDTSTDQQGSSYSDLHGWGVVYSLRTQYYMSNRWIAQLQLNRVQVQRGPNTNSAMIGVAYQLDAPDVPGPRDWAPSRSTRVTGNEVTAYLGETVVNSTDSETSLAAALEYRRGIAKYFDWTVGYVPRRQYRPRPARRPHDPALGDPRLLRRPPHARPRRGRLLRRAAAVEHRRHRRQRHRRPFRGHCLDVGVLPVRRALDDPRHLEPHRHAL